MKPFEDGSAANDEFQSVSPGTHRGELVRDLLRQRVRIPSAPSDGLKRPPLTARIQEALGAGSVLYLEAPCGYGKSHALLSALHESERSPEMIKWISFSTQDNEPARLMTLLGIALNPQPSHDTPTLAHATASHSEALSLLLAQDYWQRPDRNAVMVLDNLTSVSHPVVIELLEQLIAELPKGLSLALVSRKPLPFETHKSELEGRFTRLGAEVLELSRQETFEFYSAALASSQLTTVAIDHLYSLTEGWITPLALYQRELAVLAESRLPIQETVSVERFLRDSVLSRLTPPQQRALRVMAEMDIVSDDLYGCLVDSSCDTSFRPSIAAEAGIPMRPLPGRGRWFRLNPLFHEWLRSSALDGALDRALAASRWFCQHHQLPEALRYALLSENAEEAVRIASEGSEALLIGQDTASLLRLRRSLPPGLLERSVRLRLVYSWVHAIGGQFTQARALLEGLPDDERESLSGRINALKAFILRGEGYVDEALEVADQALAAEVLSTQGQLVTQMVRSSALCAAGRFADARDANRAAARLAREAGDSGSELLAVYTHARIELGKGALKHAEQLLRTGLDTAMNETSRSTRVGESRLQLNLVLVLWHQGREAEADRLLVTCGRHAEQARDLGLLLAMALRVLICRTQGRLEDAFVWIGRAERTMHAWQVDESVFVPVLEALKASCWLASGNVDSAAHALARLQPYRETGCVPELIPMMPGLLDLLQVRIELARGDDIKAADTLRRIRLKDGGAIPFAVEMHLRLLESLLAYRERGVAAAQKLLAQAVYLAAQEHFISPFAELRIEMSELMEKAYPHLPEGEFTRSVGQLFGLSVAKVNAAPLAEPISEREQGVLELIARGLSNQEIADQLHISLHTVKTHARRINAKLEVKSRTQAIVRARELGLL
ncbi:regulatory protein LuxR [Marinobacter lipolyticus SM19]|uniref:Regulatory protein LuxR n=1 Tax=Marinobacter lipolyticus SM19 TaxID=1318628 RepID=R8B5V6_9GAMM|nr:LuxR C-terminal-related transcriptional regulator [Marinobacter lipolyticus]EON93941.1 regulatory protein LuxR [Marinobacter lipolyticus SM19]